MNQNKKDSNELLRRFEQGTCSEEEKLWIEANYNKIASKGIEKEFELNPRDVKAEIWDEIDRLTIQKKRKVHKLKFIAAAACIIILIGSFGVYMFKNSTDDMLKTGPIVPMLVNIEEVRASPTEKETKNTDAKGQNILPHITLADGKIISLTEYSNGILVNENGIYETMGKQIASDVNTTEFNTLTTPKGYDCKFTLSDGTIVWLNAESSIRFPLAFDQNSRDIELEGEAYFEVAHDQNRPFTVKSKNQSVRVLGTEFNVRAYTYEKQVKTTLIKGSVEVAAFQKKEILQPKEQLILQDNQILKTNDFDMESVVAWKNGYFRFNGNLKEIMIDLARWYNIELDYRVPSDYKIELEAALSKNKTLKEMLELIQAATDLKFSLKERSLLIMK